MKRILVGLFLSLALCLGYIGTANAVTDGELDGERHPHVGLLIFDYDWVPWWRCSGTLLSPTVLLTAGHCTDGASGGRVWFESDATDRDAIGYPDGPGTSVEICEIYTHPEYDPKAFFLHDVGVVVLCEPVYRETYGVLPGVDQLDSLQPKRGKKDVTFTSVGYGLQKSFPDAASFKNSSLRIRMLAEPRLIRINTPGLTGDYSLLLSNNANTGGTCFGDSGGPNFLGNGNVIAGVTSFGINGNCADTGGVFRLDRQDVLDFVNDILYFQ